MVDGMRDILLKMKNLIFKSLKKLSNSNCNHFGNTIQYDIFTFKF